MNKKIVLLLLFLYAIIPLAQAGIGCDWHNSTTIKCWNEGKIQNVTYIDICGVQMANKLDRFDWATYEMGAMVFDSNNITFSSWNIDFCDVEPIIYTDNLSYYDVVWTGLFRQGNKGFDFNYSISQMLEDDLVQLKLNITLQMGFHNWNHITNLYRRTYNINIDNDDDIDWLFLENNSYGTGNPLNYSHNLKYADLTDNWLNIGDLELGEGIRWFWEEQDHEAVYLTDSPQGEVTYYKPYSPPFQNGDTLEIIHHWIDVECTIGCDPGAVLQILGTGDDPDATVLVDQYLNDPKCLWRIAKFFPFADCAISDGCHLQVDYNWSATTYVLLTDATNTPIECYDPFCRILANETTQNVWYDYNISGNKIGRNTLECSMSTNSGTWAGDWNSMKTLTELWNPPNNQNRTEFFDLGNWYAYHQANWTLWAPDNYSLYLSLNNSALEYNYTQTTGSFNFSRNTSYNETGNWTWDIYACSEHICWWSENGNWSFFIDLGEAAPPVEEDEDTDEDIIYFLLVGGILFLIVGFMIYKTGPGVNY